mgnify:CR=1 FL=1
MAKINVTDVKRTRIKYLQDDPIPNLSAKWQVDEETAYPGERIEEFIKKQFGDIETKFGKKYGAFCVSPTVDSSNFYHLWFFATDEDKAAYLADPVSNANLRLSDDVIPISTKSDSGVTYPQEISSIQGVDNITKAGVYTYEAQLSPTEYTGKVNVTWDILSGQTDGLELVNNGNVCTLNVVGPIPKTDNKIVLRATATCGNGTSFTKQKEIAYNLPLFGATFINPSNYSATLKQENVEKMKQDLAEYVADCKCYVFNSKGTKMAEINQATLNIDTLEGTVTFADGSKKTIADLNGRGCNFMVYRPAMYIKSFKDEVGHDVLQFGGKHPIDGGIKLREKYIGMFKGSVQVDKLVSQPLVVCDRNRDITHYQILAEHGGTGYTQWSYKDWCKENALHLSWFGNTNYEANVGVGRINNSWEVYNIRTGFTLPMIGSAELFGSRKCYNEDGYQYNAINFFHIEGLGEQLSEFVIGFRKDESLIYIWDDDTWSAAHDGDYTFPANGNNVNASYVTEIEAGEHFDMKPSDYGKGSSVTGYCDGYWDAIDGQILVVGGDADYGNLCGISACNSRFPATYSSNTTCARLAFFGHPTEVDGANILD